MKALGTSSDREPCQIVVATSQLTQHEQSMHVAVRSPHQVRDTIGGKLKEPVGHPNLLCLGTQLDRYEGAIQQEDQAEMAQDALSVTVVQLADKGTRHRFGQRRHERRGPNKSLGS